MAKIPNEYQPILVTDEDLKPLATVSLPKAVVAAMEECPKNTGNSTAYRAMQARKMYEAAIQKIHQPTIVSMMTPKSPFKQLRDYVLPTSEERAALDKKAEEIVQQLATDKRLWKEVQRRMEQKALEAVFG